LAEKSLAQIKAGAKAGELKAQEELIARTRERLRLAEKQLERARELRKNKALSEDDLDTRVAEVDVLRRELAQHESALVALAEVRTVDVERAEAEVTQAQASLLRAEADLEISLIRSPIDGEILKIHTRVGERIGSEGVLDLGDTRQMDVVAEVHESDILKVELDQPATVSLRNLDTTLHGRVIEVGRLIGRKDVLSSDPVDDTDARVVEVRIRLDEEDGQRVSGLSWAKVEVTIDTSKPHSLSTDMSDASTSIGPKGQPQ
jgi:HlyD family secretion protein